MFSKANDASNSVNSRFLVRGALALAFLLVISITAQAHHASITLYDREGDIEITGKVTKLSWANPHVRIQVTVTDDPARNGDWVLEAADASGLLRRGMPKGVINLGDTITAAGFPGKNGKKTIWTANILLADGREMLVYEYSKPRWGKEQNIGVTAVDMPVVARREDPSPDIFGVWFSKAGFDGNKDAGVWGGDIVLTPEASAIQSKYDASKENPFISCTRGIPEIMTGFGPLEFSQEGDVVTLHFEEFDIIRPIHMGADAESKRPPVPKDIKRGAVGYSAGHWEEGTTLVVKTTGMSFPYYDQSGLPQSASAEITEKWKLADEGNQLLYELTVVDPATFVKPVTQTKTWNWAPDQEVSEYHCDETQSAFRETGR